MENGILCFSFDDGRKDNLHVIYDIMLPLEIPVTVNITTGYVDGSCPEEMCPTSKLAMTIDDVKKLYTQPMVEIALHGDKHLNTTEDVIAGKEKLKEWLNISNDEVVGFASPNNIFNMQANNELEKELVEDALLYIRTGLTLQKYKRLKILARKVSRVLHIPFLYKMAYMDCLMKVPQKEIYSVSVLKNVTVNEVLSLVDVCIQKKKILILQFHSIVDIKECDDNWTWDIEKFKQLCAYINLKCKANLLQVKTTKNLFCKEE